jgi:hypothetical protein
MSVAESDSDYDIQSSDNESNSSSGATKLISNSAPSRPQEYIVPTLDDQDEPKFNYSRMGNDLSSILANDSASAIKVTTKFLVIVFHIKLVVIAFP